MMTGQTLNNIDALTTPSQGYTVEAYTMYLFAAS